MASHPDAEAGRALSVREQCAHAHTHTHTHSDTHSYTQTYTHTHSDTHSYTHTQTYTHTHTCTHTDAHTHTASTSLTNLSLLSYHMAASSRLMQIESEAKRTATLDFLSHEQRQAILRKRYEATMKPVIWLLEHLQVVTSQPPETNNERIFQATYQQIIASAILTLKRPHSYTSPHSAWEPFKEVGDGKYRIAGNFGRCKFSYKWL